MYKTFGKTTCEFQNFLENWEFGKNIQKICLQPARIPSDLKMQSDLLW